MRKSRRSERDGRRDGFRHDPHFNSVVKHAARTRSPLLRGASCLRGSRDGCYITLPLIRPMHPFAMTTAPCDARICGNFVGVDFRGVIEDLKFQCPTRATTRDRSRNTVRNFVPFVSSVRRNVSVVHGHLSYGGDSSGICGASRMSRLGDFRRHRESQNFMILIIVDYNREEDYPKIFSIRVGTTSEARSDALSTI